MLEPAWTGGRLISPNPAWERLLGVPRLEDLAQEGVPGDLRLARFDLFRQRSQPIYFAFKVFIIVIDGYFQLLQARV